MNKVAVDEDQSCAIGALFDDMRVPDFFIEGAGPGHAVHLRRLHTNASEWSSKRNFRSRWRAVPAKAGAAVGITQRRGLGFTMPSQGRSVGRYYSHFAACNHPAHPRHRHAEVGGPK